MPHQSRPSPPGTQPEAAVPAAACTYQLFVYLRRPCRLSPGRLGRHRLPAGWYVYTGSARRNLRARLARHLRADKRRRWHIDWLLERDEAGVCWVALHTVPECRVNRAVGGAIVIDGFGASDCRAGCGSHLRYLGTDRPVAVPTNRRRRRQVLRAFLGPK